MSYLLNIVNNVMIEESQKCTKCKNIPYKEYGYKIIFEEKVYCQKCYIKATK